eukprot:COSAG02_NODE_1554_length_11948_cov_41.539455_8_plen_91_part_01
MHHVQWCTIRFELSEECSEQDLEFCAMSADVGVDFDVLCGVLVSDMRNEDWMRHEAADLLNIEGDSVEVTGDGSEIVCNCRASVRRPLIDQ